MKSCGNNKKKDKKKIDKQGQGGCMHHAIDPSKISKNTGGNDQLRRDSSHIFLSLSRRQYLH